MLPKPMRTDECCLENWVYVAHKKNITECLRSKLCFQSRKKVAAVDNTISVNTSSYKFHSNTFLPTFSAVISSLIQKAAFELFRFFQRLLLQTKQFQIAWATKQTRSGGLSKTLKGIREICKAFALPAAKVSLMLAAQRRYNVWALFIRSPCYSSWRHILDSSWSFVHVEIGI